MPQDYPTSFRYVVNAALSGATVLTANTRAARCVMSACEQRLRPQKVWNTPRILPLSAWMQQMWREAQAQGATGKVLLRPMQELHLWEQMIERNGGMAELLRPATAAPEALQAWQLLQAYRISRKSAAFAATRQSREFLDWSRAYESLCRDSGLIDGAVLPDELISLLRASSESAPREIVVWGFDHFTPQQLSLFDALRDISSCEVIAPKRSGGAVPLRFELADTEQEILSASRWSRAHLERSPDKRIAVVIPGLAGVRSTVERIFLRELNPEFFGAIGCERAFDISLGTALDSYAVTRTAILALRFVTEPLAFAELRELLCSPYLRGAQGESSARSSLVGMFGESMPAKVSLPTFIAGLNKRNVRDFPCSQLRTIFKEFSSRAVTLPKQATYGRWMRIVNDLLLTLGWPGESANRTLDSIEYQATQKWRDLLSEVASLESISPSCSLRTAFTAIFRGAASSVFAPENRAAAVQILGETEAAGSLFDAIWISGLTDEAWPPRRRANPFLPVSLQQRAAIPTSSPELSVVSAKEVLSRLIDSAPEVVLSSPLNEGDRELRVSSLVAKLPLADLAHLRPAPSFCWDTMPTADCETIEDNTAPQVAFTELVHRGTSVIEKQSSCPFRAFAESRLEAAGCDEPPEGIRPTVRGNLVECALQRVWESLREQNVLLNIDASELQLVIENSVDAAIAEKFESGGDPVREKLIVIERGRLIRLIHEWLRLERKRDPFEVLEHQRKIECNLGSMAIKGAIDRIDRVADGFVIIDYKAGLNYSASHWKLPRPDRPQLPLYAVALAQTGAEIAGLSFAKVSTGNCELAGLSVRPEVLGKRINTLSRYTEGRTLPEQLAAWEEEFSRLATAHLCGCADVDPKVPPSTGGNRNTSCAYCELEALCRVAELNLAVESDEGEGND